jgi:hypothetical protein
MPENTTHPQDPPTESGSHAASMLAPPAAPPVGSPDHGIARPPVFALPGESPPVLPPEAHALLELVGRGLAPDADESTRGAARELWERFGQLITTAPVTPAAAMMPTAPGMSVAPGMPALPGMPAAPMMPTAPVMPTPIATAARALRQLPPDQLLELALQRLRAALPAGTTVPTPKGIQFQLVPIPSMPIRDR